MKKLIFYLLLIVHFSLYIMPLFASRFFGNNCMCQVVQEWEARYIGPYNSDGASSMCLDSYGNVYVTGESQRSAYIYDYATVKFNKWGNLNWVARYNWPGDTMGGATAYSIALDKNDNIYVSGTAPVAISGLRAKITPCVCIPLAVLTIFRVKGLRYTNDIPITVLEVLQIRILTSVLHRLVLKGTVFN